MDTAPRRGWPWWYVITWIATALVMLMAVAWWWLPRWAPELVFDWSPWPEPAIRAYFVRHEGDDGPISRRVGEWGPRATPALVRRLGESDWYQVSRSIEMLGQTHDPAAIPALEQFAIHNEEARENCLDSIGQLASAIHDESAVVWLLRDAPWGHGYATWGRPSRKILEAFKSMPPAVVAIAMVQMGSSDAVARTRAVYALREIDGDAVDHLIVAAVDDADPHVRAAAAGALGWRREIADGGALARHLDDDEWPCRLAAAVTLGQRKDPRGIDSLLAWAESSDANVRTDCLNGLTALMLSHHLDKDQQIRVETLLLAGHPRP
jgi:hypothetical protein